MSHQAQLDERFSASYPYLSHFLEANIRTGVDGYNLLEMLHRVMRHSNSEESRNLVIELEGLAKDTSFTDSELVELFGRDVPPEFQIVTVHNCRALLNTLAGYLRYLYDEEHVRGT